MIYVFRMHAKVINFYMGMVVKWGESPDYPRVFAHSTFFYLKLKFVGHVAVCDEANMSAYFLTPLSLIRFTLVTTGALLLWTLTRRR